MIIAISWESSWYCNKTPSNLRTVTDNALWVLSQAKGQVWAEHFAVLVRGCLYLLAQNICTHCYPVFKTGWTQKWCCLRVFSHNCSVCEYKECQVLGRKEMIHTNQPTAQILYFISVFLRLPYFAWRVVCHALSGWDSLASNKEISEKKNSRLCQSKL